MNRFNALVPMFLFSCAAIAQETEAPAEPQSWAGLITFLIVTIVIAALCAYAVLKDDKKDESKE